MIRSLTAREARQHEATRSTPAAARTLTRSAMIEPLEGRQLCAGDAGALTVGGMSGGTFVGPLPPETYAALLKGGAGADEMTTPTANVAFGNDKLPTDPTTRPVRYWSSTGGNDDGGTGGWLRSEYRKLPR